MAALDSYYIFFNDNSYAETTLVGNNKLLRYKPMLDLCKIYSKKKGKIVLAGGFYSLKGDTIVMDRYFTYGMDWFVNLRKEYFKIIDRNHIKRIGTQLFTLSKGPSKIGKRYTALYEFVPTSTLPSADCVGTKNDKNMWYDENEWLNWKKRMGR